MTNAIGHILDGYIALNDRDSLETLREHRQKLLSEALMRSNKTFSFERMIAELREEIALVEAALEKTRNSQEASGLK
jgi:hypothetical protein